VTGAGTVAEITPGMRLVFFAFGVARAARPDKQLPGPALMRLLCDLGLSDSAARSVLLRMRRDGWLSSERVGREARYQLTPILDAAQARVERQLHGDRPAWSGSFNGMLYMVPERHRAYRDRLRICARLLGYVRLRPGLVIATTDRYEELTSLLPPPPPDSQILSVRLTLSAQNSHQIAGELWGLDALAARYRAVLADARDRTTRAERRPPSNTPAFQAFAATTLPVFEILREDPDLPAALLPPDWPGQQLGAALQRAFQVFSPLLQDYLATIISNQAAPPAPQLTPQKR
jgi:phenylacetic acid degradation operon negative regulatory protein